MVMPMIQAAFSISGGELDLEEISRRLGVSPTRTCQKTDFPQHNRAKAGWTLEVREENAFSVSALLEKLIQQLAGVNPFEKVDTICTLCRELDAAPRIDIIVHMQGGDGPEIVLSPAQVLFAAAIGAEIDFDLHCYP